MTIDQKALEASADRLEQMAAMRNIPSILTRSGREFIAEKAITAYLAALPASDHAGLVERLEAQSQAVGEYKSSRTVTKALLREAATALSAQASPAPLEGVTAPAAWHRDDGDSSILLYTLKEQGWRRGEPVMVNDITVRIENAPGSQHDLSEIADKVLSAIVGSAK